MNVNWRRRTGKSLLVCGLAASFAAAGSPLTALAAPPRSSAAQVAPSLVEPGPVGLDGLSEQAVISELADRGLTNLLNREFDLNKIPPAEREGFIALKALRDLADKTKPLGNVRRLKLMRDSVTGLNTVLTHIDKVDDLMNYASSLIERGIEPDINTLEYWGENPVTQKQIKPAIETALAMLDKVSEQAKRDQLAIEKTMKGANDPAGERWLKLDGMASNAIYFRNMVTYYLALATDASSKPGADERKKTVDMALKYLETLDNGETGVQPLVHTRMGKLNWAKGDYVKARKFFNDVVEKTADKKAIVPEPNPGQQFEARFFLVLTEISDKKPDAGGKALADLNKWVSANIPPADQGGVSAALQLASFRLMSLQADLATDPAQKRKLDQQASDILTKLSEEHPEFRTIITEQLVNRLPDNADLSKQSVPVLQALTTKGNVERTKPEKDPVDSKILQRAADAAKELTVRKTGVSPKGLADAMLLRAMFLDRLKDDVGAGNAYVDFATRYANSDKPLATQTMQRAVTILFELQKGEKRDEPSSKQLYGRTLATAVGAPFQMKPLFYFYGNYLRQKNDPDAAGYYLAVPKGDPNEFNARFYALVSLNSQLENPKLPDATRKQLEAKMTGVIDQVRALGRTAKPTEAMRIRLAMTTELGADLALKQSQPKRALELLEGFDESLTGLPNATSLAREANQYRVDAYLATNQMDKAVDQVQKLAQSDPNSTAPFVAAVLARLKQDRDLAKVQGKSEEVGRISASQANLTGYLVKWSSESTDEKIKKLAPQYRIYDANVKRQAGVELSDPAQKKKFLDDALAAYQSIKAQGNLDPGTESTVALGMGLCEYDLGNYKEAQQDLGRLVVQMKLGGPINRELDSKTGELREKDNEAYWEAMYKWLRCKVELANANPADPIAAKLLDSSKETLRNLFITNVDRTGGDKWADQFTELRKQLIPEWVPGSIVPPSAPTAPAPPPPSAAPTTAPAIGAGASDG